MSDTIVKVGIDTYVSVGLK